MAGEYLSGNYRVRAIRSAFDDKRRLFKKARDNAILRRHALKLRYWPQNHPEDESGQVVDLNWDWIRSMPGLKVGELRIDDEIGGHDNLRIIFFVGNQEVREPLPLIWVIRVMQKKRTEFSKNDVAVFRARRLLVIERFYNSRTN
jgi:hypothetical protein